MKLLKQLLSSTVNKKISNALNNRLNKGQYYESLAENHLLSAGLKIKEKNFRCRSGEIDLIMQHGDVLVFVEVRFRSESRYSSAIESVDLRKQRKLAKTASYYLSLHKLHNQVHCRFDVVAFEDHSLQWIKNAFVLSDL